MAGSAKVPDPAVNETTVGGVQLAEAAPVAQGRITEPVEGTQSTVIVDEQGKGMFPFTPVGTKLLGVIGMKVS